MKNDTDPLPKWYLVFGFGLVLFGLLVKLNCHVEIKYRKPKPTPEPGLYLEPIGPKPDSRYEAIRSFLRLHNESVVDNAYDFVALADLYSVDPYLLVAIGAHESGYFTKCRGGNCFGINSANGYVYFDTLAQGIEYTAQLLSKPLYAGKTIEQINEKYAADKKWSAKVKRIYDQI